MERLQGLCVKCWICQVCMLNMHKKLGCDSSVYVCLVPGEINNLRIFIFIRMLRCYIFRFKGNKQFSNLHFDGRGAAKHPWSCPLFVLPTQSFLSFETGEDVVTLYQQERDILTHQKALWDTPFSCSSLTPEKNIMNSYHLLTFSKKCWLCQQCGCYAPHGML